jgi:hypothetical protein
MYTTEQVQEVYDAFEGCRNCGLCSVNDVINLVNWCGIEEFTRMLNSGELLPHVKRTFEMRLNCRP